MSAMRQAFTLEQSVDHGSTRREHGRQALNKEKFRISRPSARHTGEGGGAIPQIRHMEFGLWWHALGLFAFSAGLPGLFQFSSSTI